MLDELLLCCLQTPMPCGNECASVLSGQPCLTPLSRCDVSCGYVGASNMRPLSLHTKAYIAESEQLPCSIMALH